MLSSSLPPVKRPGAAGNSGELYEAFALSYLASYNGDTANARTYESHGRAFGYTRIDLFPRGGDGGPACVVATYGTGRARRIVIAIEGMSSTNQLISLTRMGQVKQYGASDQVVLKIYDDYATSLQTRLDAAGVFAEKNWGQLDIVWAGYSLGGAVAEVMGQKWTEANMNVQSRIIKFGAPRVGNSGWNAARNLRTSVESYYVEHDPMHLFPATLPNVNFHTLLSGQGPFAQLDSTEGSTALQFFTGLRIAFDSLSPLDVLRVLRQLADPIVSDGNPWWYHLIFSYRQMLMNDLHRLGQRLDYYRFRYLEYPNENSFQSNWRPGLILQYADQTLADPAPTPVDVPPVLSGIIAQREVDTAPGEGGGGGDWGGRANAAALDDGGGGGDWGYVPSSSPPRRSGRRNLP